MLKRTSRKTQKTLPYPTNELLQPLGYLFQCDAKTSGATPLSIWERFERADNNIVQCFTMVAPKNITAEHIESELQNLDNHAVNEALKDLIKRSEELGNLSDEADLTFAYSLTSMYSTAVSMSASTQAINEIGTKTKLIVQSTGSLPRIFPKG